MAQIQNLYSENSSKLSEKIEYHIKIIVGLCLVILVSTVFIEERGKDYIMFNNAEFHLEGFIRGRETIQTRLDIIETIISKEDITTINELKHYLKSNPDQFNSVKATYNRDFMEVQEFIDHQISRAGNELPILLIKGLEKDIQYYDRKIEEFTIHHQKFQDSTKINVYGQENISIDARLYVNVLCGILIALHANLIVHMILQNKLLNKLNLQGVEFDNFFQATNYWIPKKDYVTWINVYLVIKLIIFYFVFFAIPLFYSIHVINSYFIN